MQERVSCSLKSYSTTGHGSYPPLLLTNYGSSPGMDTVPLCGSWSRKRNDWSSTARGERRENSCRGIREWREATEDLRSYCYNACRYSMLCVRAVLRAYHIYSRLSLKTTHVRNQPIPHRSLADEHMCQLLVARVSRSMSHARLNIS